jgi:hypothetical protein
MILIKMNRLGIDPEKYKNLERFDGKFSYVLINPPNDFNLKIGDIVYLLKTGYKKDKTPNFIYKHYNMEEEEESMLKLNEMNEDKSHIGMKEKERNSRRNSLANFSFNLRQSFISKSSPKTRSFLTSSVNNLKTKSHDKNNLDYEAPFK